MVSGLVGLVVGQLSNGCILELLAVHLSRLSNGCLMELLAVHLRSCILELLSVHLTWCKAFGNLPCSACRSMQPWHQHVRRLAFQERHRRRPLQQPTSLTVLLGASLVREMGMSSSVRQSLRHLQTMTKSCNQCCGMHWAQRWRTWSVMTRRPSPARWPSSR